MCSYPVLGQLRVASVRDADDYRTVEMDSSYFDLRDEEIFGRYFADICAL